MIGVTRQCPAEGFLPKKVRPAQWPVQWKIFAPNRGPNREIQCFWQRRCGRLVSVDVLHTFLQFYRSSWSRRASAQSPWQDKGGGWGEGGAAMRNVQVHNSHVSRPIVALLTDTERFPNVFSNAQLNGADLNGSL